MADAQKKILRFFSSTFSTLKLPIPVMHGTAFPSQMYNVPHTKLMAYFGYWWFLLHIICHTFKYNTMAIKSGSHKQKLTKLLTLVLKTLNLVVVFFHIHCNNPFSYSWYWIKTSLQWRLMRGNNIIEKSLISFVFEKTLHISLSCQLVQLKY